jgi:hypothetical protein
MNKILVGFIAILSLSIKAQVIDNSNFTPSNTNPTFSKGNSPVILIDEAHQNFHTMDESFQPFAKILRSDGYTVNRNTQLFSDDSLKNIDVLVIANALNAKNETKSDSDNSWDLPNYSAFTRSEIEAIFHWVKKGGSLFLIADHMPFPKASADLAAIFGFHLNNGYAWGPNKGVTTFRTADNSLTEHAVVHGSNKKEMVDTVVTFTGHAFLPPPNAKSLLVFGENTISFMPNKSWKKNKETPELPIVGWSQGATLEFHKGRVAVFGEASMFTAQFDEKSNSLDGLRTKGAEQNEQFLLNVMHWLSGKL